MKIRNPKFIQSPHPTMQGLRTFSQREKVTTQRTLSLWERVRVLRGSGEGRIILISFTFCILSFAFILFGSGCARTVTTLWTYGDQMMVEVTMKGTIATSANRYFLVLSLDPNYKIPLPSPNLDQEAPEFIEPGMVPQVGSPEAYYTKFFSTWSGYIVLDRNEYYLAKGPFVIDQAFTREVISILGETGDKITFSFRLQQMFGDLPDQTQIYFDFVSVPWPDGEEKIPADHLPSTNNYISNIAGSIFAMDDLEDPSLDPSLDIIKCRVEIQ